MKPSCAYLSRGEKRMFTRADGYSEECLLNFAHDHLASAEFLFKKSPSFFDSAGFLGHLGIELLLKALLLRRTDKFPNSHDLAELRKLLEDAAPEIEFTEEGLSILKRVNKFHTLRYSYPKGSAEIGTEDRIPLRNLAHALVGAFPPELQQKFASQLEKGGRVLTRYRKKPSGAG